MFVARGGAVAAKIARRFDARQGRGTTPEHEASDGTVFHYIGRRWEDPAVTSLQVAARRQSSRAIRSPSCRWSRPWAGWTYGLSSAMAERLIEVVARGAERATISV
jgi:hypothetical protein